MKLILRNSLVVAPLLVEEKGGGAFVTPTLGLVKCRVTIKSKRK